CATLAIESERAVSLNRGVLRFDAAHVGESRPFPQEPAQFRQFRRRSHCVHLDASIVEIASVACQIQIGGRALHEVAEPNSLYPSANELSLCCCCHPFILV